jgi:hypothetical protein
MDISAIEDRNDEFKDALDEDVRSLIRLHEKDEETVGRPGAWLEAIRRSAVVLSAANLESYLEDVACFSLRILATSGVYATHFPKNYRLWNFQQEANNRSLGLEDSEEIVALSQKLWARQRPISEDELRLDELRNEFSNPTPSDVDWLMGLFDQSDYVAGVTVQVSGKPTNAESALGELARRRNEIAHGETDQKPDIEDVKRLRKFVHYFSNRVKRDLTQVVENAIERSSSSV